MSAEKAGPGSYAARAAADIAGAAAHRFPAQRRASTRYSLFVNLMRFVLPAVALALIAAVVVWPQLHDDGKMRFHLDFAKIAPQAAKSLTMVKPRFTGLDSGKRPYTVTAESASQQSGGSPLVDLEKPVADVTLKDGTWVALRSAEGTYNQSSHDLELRGEVSLFQDKGYEFRTARAHLNLRDGVAHGDAPVEGQGPFGHLTSAGFRISQHGKYVVFTGPAHLTIYPGAESSARLYPASGKGTK